MPSTHSNSHASHGHDGRRHHHSSRLRKTGASTSTSSGASSAAQPTEGTQPGHRAISRIPVVPRVAPRASGDAAHPASRGSASPPRAFDGKTLSALCVCTAFLGLAVELANEFVAHENQTNTSTLCSIVSVVFGASAFALGTHALVEQRRRWSSRTRRRLLLGLPVAGLTLLSVAPNFWEAPVSEKTPAAPSASSPTAPTAATNAVAGTDDSLAKPGWYGEYTQDGVVVAVSSFEPNAFESQRFNRRLRKPVSYATFTAINLGRATPVVLNNLRATLRLDSGETVQSLPIEPLLEENGEANRPLLKRLAPPLKLGAGEMLPDVPICMASDFAWSRVTAVSLSLDGGEVAIPGRMMTAKEKNALLDKHAGKRGGDRSQDSSEAWFKNL